jgi:hypothetical protein
MSERICPICRKPLGEERKYRPFCGKRCADVDLQRWFAGAYAVPVEEADDSLETPSRED